GLDLVHVHGARADGHGHVDALALGAGGVGGHEAGQLRLVIHHHVQVGAKAAGGQDDGLGVDGDGRAVLVGGGDAHGGAVGVGEDLVGGGVHDELDAQLLTLGLEQGDHVAAHRDSLALAVHRAVDALDRSAAKAGNAGQLDALLAQPGDGVGRVGAQGLHQGGVVGAVAADQGVQLHQLHRVKVAHGVGLVLGPLPGHGVGQGGDGLVAGPLAGGGLQGLFDAGRLGKLVLVLGGGLGGVHAAGGADRVAAHHGLALDDDHVFALVGGGNGGGHACAARAHDDDVGIHRTVLSGGGVPAAGEVGRIQAGGGQSGGQGLVDGVGGDGGARDHVDG